MNENDKSTPLIFDADDIASASMPEDNQSERAAQSSAGSEDLIENDNPKQEDGLIFGKFKTMDEARKGYQEAERAIARAADLEKEIEAYQHLSEQYEQDVIARGEGFNDRLDMALNYDVRQHELDNYVLAAAYTLPPQKKLQVMALINKCRRGAGAADIAQIRRFFSPEVISLAAEDIALYKNARRQDYDAARQQDRSIRYDRKLKAFERQNGSWIDSPLKEALLTQAIELSDGKIDLGALKDVVNAIEDSAVRKYQKNTAFRCQNAEAQDSLREPGNGNSRSKSKKWLTKEEYYKLTPEQEAEKYDLIVEQILLEKQGLLPKMLTR